MKQGLFITVEGPDGSGKSTQIAVLKEFFESRNVPVVLTREPGGTAIGEKIRAIILDRENDEMEAMTEAMLYAASRAQHVAQVIRPALLSGKVVICDRFVDSSIAYQGYGRGLGDAVRIINEYAIDGCLPDVTFLFKLDPEIGKERLSGRSAAQDRLEQEKLDFHRRVYEGYLALERHEARIGGNDASRRIVGIDASRSIPEISREILEETENIFAVWQKQRNAE